MSLKKYFKPDLRKIIIFIVLSSLVFVYAYSWLLRNVIVCQAVGCPTVEEVAEKNLLYLSPFVLAVCYVVTCWMVWLYEEATKERK